MADGDRLISKPTLAVIKDALAELCSHTTMTNLFEQYEFEIDPRASFSNKVGKAGAYLDHQDWNDPGVVQRLFDLLGHRFVEIGSRGSFGVTNDESCQRIIKVLSERDGFEWDGRRFAQRGSATLLHVADKAKEFSRDTLEKEIERVLASVDRDPDDAITAAKNIVESTCRAILADFGEEPASGIDLGPLTKQTLRKLQLLPEQVSDEQKGADAAKKVLHSLGTAVQGLGELRNLYSDAHGKGPGHKGLEPRHARLAAAFAGSLAAFLMETHERRKE